MADDEFEGRDDDDVESYPSRKQNRGRVGIDDIRRSLLGGRRRGRVGRPPLSESLPPHVANIMGEANLSYTTGDIPRALHHLGEVIKNAPNFPDPYMLLGDIFEERGEIQKAVQYHLIAAELRKSDVDLWKRLGVMSKSQELTEQALYCFSKAASLQPTDADVLYEKASLHYDLGDLNKAKDGFYTILQLRPNDLQVVKELTRIHYDTEKSDELDVAIKLLEQAIRQPPSGQHVDYTHINFLAELHMKKHDYTRALDVITRETTAYRKRLESEGFIQHWTHEPVPLDLKIKAGICKLFLNKHQEAERAFTELSKTDATSYGDLYFEVAEALHQHEQYASALKFYSALTHTEHYNKAGTWLRMAQCYDEMEDLRAAANCYLAVLNDLPERDDVRIALSELYKELHDHRRALAILNHGLMEKPVPPKDYERLRQDHQLPEQSPFDEDTTEKREYAIYHVADTNELTRKLKILHQSSLISLSMGQQQEFSDKAMELYLHFRRDKTVFPERLRRPQPVSSASAEDGPALKHGSHPQDLLLLPLSTAAVRRGQSSEEPPVLGLTPKEWFDMLVQLALGLALRGATTQALEILHACSRASVFYYDEQRRMSLSMLTLAVAVRDHRFLDAAETLRAVINQQPAAVMMHALYCACMTGSVHALSVFAAQYLQKYFARLAHKFCSVATQMMYGHIMSLSKSYHIALDYYLRAKKESSDGESEPLIVLCIGITYLHLAMQRKTPNRHWQILKGMAYLQDYKRKRRARHPTEVNYNLGRAFHHVGLTYLAIPLYEKVLAEGDGSRYDLRREAAHNLSLIYRAAGSWALARHVLQEYCTI